MKSFTFHNEIKILVTQVIDALSNTVIKRYDENTDTVVDNIAVNIKYMPKTRTLHDLVNKNLHLQVPVMSIFPTNINFDAERVFNKIEGFSIRSSILSADGSHYPQPMPIILNMTLSIMARYSKDIEQIITTIFSNFFPYIIISYKYPDLDEEIRCRVEWDGNIPLKIPIDIAPNAPYRIEADVGLKIYGFIFRNSYNPYGIIHNIRTNYTAVSGMYEDDFSEDYLSLLAQSNPLNTDYITISGRPQLRIINPYSTIASVSGKTFDLYGDMFNFVSGIYVSATDLVYPVSSYVWANPLSGDKHLSAVYTGFSAVPVIDWHIFSNNYIAFTLPTPEAAGLIDVFAWSPSGIGQLTVDSTRPTTNPYSTTTPEYSAYVEPQVPWVSGINVFVI